MKISVPLKKILTNELRPILKAMMEKWSETKDIFVLVKISQAIAVQEEAWQATVKLLTDQNGYDLGDHKSITPDEINNALLMKYGKEQADGKRSMANVAGKEAQDFRDEVGKASMAVRNYGLQQEEALNLSVELEIPRIIKVTEKAIRKEEINAYGCYILEPFLDLTALAEPADLPKTEETKE